MAVILDITVPKSCGGCPFCIYTADEKRAIGYCNTSDEDYYCKALDRFMEYDKVDGGLDILGKPSDCPLKEVPSGKWIDHKDEHQCSHCKEIIIVSPDYWNDAEYEYCPNCGAKMVEPQESEEV